MSWAEPAALIDQAALFDQNRKIALRTDRTHHREPCGVPPVQTILVQSKSVFQCPHGCLPDSRPVGL